ncbi:hypothetical protein C6P92_18125 [Burkholderia multivorans]|nr:hypothetical protein C6P92_18125 [Burkholderia multivorans]PRG43455.1 hypothetical protein C6T62_09965 [Burkholderia multivorans]PRG97448.1 hypothetical protein C6V04_03395 [Burkholderia multivorans]RSB76694.1 hypothetical protein EGT33_04930 [Burkholderia multivorans]
MSRWMAPLRCGGCRTRATCCPRVVREAGAPMSQTRHAFDRRRHRWRKHESRAAQRMNARHEGAATAPIVASDPAFLLIERSIKNR